MNKNVFLNTAERFKLKISLKLHYFCFKNCSICLFRAALYKLDAKILKFCFVIKNSPNANGTAHLCAIQKIGV
jgi:hypothetical protein